jgi:hypothetical protein
MRLWLSPDVPGERKRDFLGALFKIATIEVNGKPLKEADGRRIFVSEGVVCSIERVEPGEGILSRRKS